MLYFYDFLFNLSVQISFSTLLFASEFFLTKMSYMYSYLLNVTADKHIRSNFFMIENYIELNISLEALPWPRLFQVGQRFFSEHQWI